MDAVEIDPNFEPQMRARSNTWPCRPREDFIDGQQTSPASDETGSGDHVKDGLALNKKTSSRRNAWGNLSYADLITKAIQASPEQRLTLSQIYDWMVQNVPYFKDKGDSTSSAGWKNSIRHNLSLHSRFMRIQNEGTGKSSWWVLNPDAKPGKAPRRRAGSMETKNLEKKRGRLKKRVEAIRAAQENGTLPPDDLLDLQYGFSLSPEFRARAGSNASSCGRLSPIQAAVEPDLHDGQVPPMSPIPWGVELDGEDSFSRSSEGFTLVDSLVGGLNLSESKNLGIVPNEGTDIEMLGSTIKQELMSGGSMCQYNQNSFDEYGTMPAPPSYTDHMQQTGPQQTAVLDLDQNMALQNRTYTNMATKQQMFAENDPYQVGLLVGQGLSPQQRMSSPVSAALGINTQRNSPGRSPQLSPSNYTHNYMGQMPSPQLMRRSPQQLNMSPQQQQQQQQQQQPQPQQMVDSRSLLQQCLEAPNDSLLRAALTQSSPPYQQQQQQQKLVSQQQPYTQFNNIYSVAPMQTRPFLNNMSNNVSMNQLMMNNSSVVQNPVPMEAATRNISNPSLADIDTENMLDLDYDVEQLLRHELAIDSNLDFTFDSNNPSTQGVSSTSENRNFVR